MDVLSYLYTAVTLASVLPYAVAAIVLYLSLAALSKKRDYSDKVIEIKEAQIGVNNLMKDPIKRSILRTLRGEKKYMSMISRDLGQSAPRIRYHLKRLEKTRLIKSYKLTREAYVSLTKEGQWCLDAINYYYPATNFQLVVSRLKRAVGLSKIRRMSRTRAGQADGEAAGINTIFSRYFE